MGEAKRDVPPNQLMGTMDPQNWEPDFTEVQETLHGKIDPAINDPLPRHGSADPFGRPELPAGQQLPPPPVAGQNE